MRRAMAEAEVGVDAFELPRFAEERAHLPLHAFLAGEAVRQRGGKLDQLLGAALHVLIAAQGRGRCARQRDELRANR